MTAPFESGAGTSVNVTVAGDALRGAGLYACVWVDGGAHPGASCGAARSWVHVRRAGPLLVHVRLFWCRDDTAASPLCSARVHVALDSRGTLTVAPPRQPLTAGAARDDLMQPRPPLPLCALTIVLNGMPWITHHARALAESGDATGRAWLWAIVEGAAAGRADAARPYATGALDEWVEPHTGRSRDGTAAYIDALEGADARVVVVRPPRARGGAPPMWVDKTAMFNAGAAALDEALRRSGGGRECTLLHLDADELWAPRSLGALAELLGGDGSAPCAYFDAHHFVAPGLLSVTRGGYGHDDQVEWLRAWRYAQGMRFAAHAPPRLAAPRGGGGGGWRVLDTTLCVPHAVTAARGLVFSHYAYVDTEQVRFKEAFYGYRGAVAQWEALGVVAAALPPPPRAGDEVGDDVPSLPLWEHLAWVRAGTRAAPAWGGGLSPQAPVVPAPAPCGAHGECGAADAAALRRSAALALARAGARCAGLRVVVDGAAFGSLDHPGIARVWAGVLPRLPAALPTGACVAVLVRAGTDAAVMADLRWAAGGGGGVTLMEVPSVAEGDAEMLARVSAALGAHVFLSSLYTAPAARPGVGGAAHPPTALLLHDCIPEALAWDMSEPQWAAKAAAVAAARAIVAVSHATASACARAYPRLPSLAAAAVARNAVDDVFRPLPRHHARAVAAAAGLDLRGALARRAWVLLLVGAREGYKGAATLYGALARSSVLARRSVVRCAA